MIERHPRLQDTREALEKSLWPHVSGTFEEGFSGSSENAGLGLFFISEMAKLIGGRLLLASREAALLLTADPEGGDIHPIKFLRSGLGYQGTLVAFEIPLASVADYEGLIGEIQKRAKERTPKRAQHNWIHFDRQPPDATVFKIRYASEDTAHAVRFARDQIEPRIMQKESIVLDFDGVEIATQSYLHALLYDAIRLAWARRSFLYVMNASSSVKSGLELLEGYALGG
ncbi:MAG: STAS-like domain-containing protein [Proteobacteria bacterium]|nr:STAS-like domain-containing protein [Pseudomonadota bacterium]